MGADQCLQTKTVLTNADGMAQWTMAGDSVGTTNMLVEALEIVKERHGCKGQENSFQPDKTQV